MVPPGVIRRAVESDAQRLVDVRRASILELAPPLLPFPRAQEWADAHGPEWVLNVLRERNVWVSELDGDVVGWISVTANRIDGLYTSPRYAGQGVGTQLLRFAEAQLERLGYEMAILDASVNAEAFYRRRGYEDAGSRPSEGEALPMSRRVR